MRGGVTIAIQILIKGVEMAYLDSINERLVYECKTHWIIYVIPILIIFFGFISFSVLPELPELGVILALVGIICLIYEIIYAWTTELAITEKSVIAKWGLIKRDTIEVRINKVESIRLNQGILGRILGYGTVIVVGTGSSSAPIRYIKQPVRFKKELSLLQEKLFKD